MLRELLNVHAIQSWKHVIRDSFIRVMVEKLKKKAIDNIENMSCGRIFMFAHI